MAFQLIWVGCANNLESPAARPAPSSQAASPQISEEQARRRRVEEMDKLGLTVMHETVAVPEFRLSIKGAGPFDLASVPSISCERLNTGSTTAFILGTLVIFKAPDGQLREFRAFLADPIRSPTENGGNVEYSWLKSLITPGRNLTLTGKGTVRIAVFPTRKRARASVVSHK